MECEDEAEGAQGLLAARQLGHLLPRLILRSHLEHHTLREWVKLVDRLHFCVSTVGDQSVYLLDVVGDELEAFFELLTPLFLELVVCLSLLTEPFLNFAELVLLDCEFTSFDLVTLQYLDIAGVCLHLLFKLDHFSFNLLFLLGKGVELLFIEGMQDVSILQVVLVALAIDVSLGGLCDFNGLVSVL